MLASGDHILLRRLSVRDLSAFMAYRADPEVARFQDWARMAADQARDFLADAEAQTLFERGAWHQIAIARRPDDALLGDLGIRLSDDGAEAELGITLSREAQGKGLGEAACRLAFNLVWRETAAGCLCVWTLAENHAARRLIGRLGLEEVGVEHGTAADGSPITEHAFRLMRPAAR